MHLNAYAKVNWALAITGTRAIGANCYHELDMVMQRIMLCDVLEIAPSEAEPPSLSIEMQGYPGIDAAKNIVARAARALANELGCIPAAAIRMAKHIPAQAGLGGGSADAAIALRTLCRQWHADIPYARLMDIALKLGADVPFFMDDTPLKRVRGIGEQLQSLALPGKPAVNMVLAMPDCDGLPTAQVFARYDELARSCANAARSCADDTHAVADDALHAVNCPRTDIPGAIEALRDRDWRRMRECAINELLPAAASLRPEIPALIERLYSLGARYANMSGSGSAVYGIFEDECEAMKIRDTLRASTRAVFATRAVFEPLGPEAGNAQD